MTGELQGDAHVSIDIPSVAVDDLPSATTLLAVMPNEAQIFENIDMSDDG